MDYSFCFATKPWCFTVFNHTRRMEQLKIPSQNQIESNSPWFYKMAKVTHERKSRKLCPINWISQQSAQPLTNLSNKTWHISSSVTTKLSDPPVVVGMFCNWFTVNHWKSTLHQSTHFWHGDPKKAEFAYTTLKSMGNSLEYLCWYMGCALRKHKAKPFAYKSATNKTPHNIRTAQKTEHESIKCRRLAAFCCQTS